MRLMATRTAYQIINELIGGLEELRSALVVADRPSASAAAAPAARKAPAPARGRKRKQRASSPGVHARRVLQGKYLGAVRQLSKAKRAEVKQILLAKGPEAAIRAAIRLRK
jgi:hypothetical protein